MKFERALIIGASGGIGAALASAVDAREVVTLSRRDDGFDLLDDAGMAGFAETIPGPFDLIIDATGALEIEGAGPEKALSQIDADVMARQFAINAIGPALILKHFSDHLTRQGRSVFVSLSARVGSIGDNRLGGWISYRASKAALNQVIKTAAIELARSRKQSVCVALHPGTVETDLTRKYLGGHPSVTPCKAAENLLGVIDRLGPAETGGFFDWRGERVPF